LVAVSVAAAPVAVRRRPPPRRQFHDDCRPSDHDYAPANTTTSGAPPVTEPDLSGVEGLSDEVRAQLADLIREAQEIRDLPFLTPPRIIVVSEEELEARVRASIEEESEGLPADEALYKMLGLLAETADYESILADLYGEQAGGYYDGETGEIVVPAREDGFTIIQQATMVHELVHALTDQHFEQFDDWMAMIDEERLDEAVAYQALFEGDATKAQLLWIRTLSGEEIGEFLAGTLDIETAALDAAPRFLQESLLFPYDTGLFFVEDLFQEGGWDEVNDAYSTLLELTGSTEQVINPDDYTRDLPFEVPIPDIAVPGYELERTSVWGEQGFRLLLNQGEGVSTMATAADGWGGDSYHQWFDGENAALLIVWEGDSRTDVAELEDALLQFSTESFPQDHFAWVEQLNGSLYFIAADVPAVGEQIRATAGLD
jgi:hypothetical protein